MYETALAPLEDPDDSARGLSFRLRSPRHPSTTGRVIREECHGSGWGAGCPSGTRRGAEPFWRSSISSIRQQVLGHTQRGRVDQAAVQGDRAHARIGRLLHRGDDPARAGDQLGVGREDLVRELDLAGVDAPLALESQIDARLAATR